MGKFSRQKSQQPTRDPAMHSRGQVPEQVPPVFNRGHSLQVTGMTQQPGPQDFSNPGLMQQIPVGYGRPAFESQFALPDAPATAAPAPIPEPEEPDIEELFRAMERFRRRDQE